MLSYIVKRVLGMIPAILIISFITFVVIQLPPGDFVTSVQAQVAASGGVWMLQRLKRYVRVTGWTSP